MQFKLKTSFNQTNQYLKMDLLQNFYETTLLALKETKNDRLWFKTKLKLGKLYYDNEEYIKLAKVLKELHKSCQVIQLNDPLDNFNIQIKKLLNKRQMMEKMILKKALNY